MTRSLMQPSVPVLAAPGTHASIVIPLTPARHGRDEAEHRTARRAESTHSRSHLTRRASRVTDAAAELAR